MTTMAKLVCTSRVLTPQQPELASRRSIEVNPLNADEERVHMRTPVGRRGGGRRLVVDIGKKWSRAAWT